MNKKEKKMVECEVCGAKIKEGERFCSVCAPSEKVVKKDSKISEKEATPKEPEISKGVQIKEDGEGKEEKEKNLDEDDDGEKIVDPFGQDFSDDK